MKYRVFYILVLFLTSSVAWGQKTLTIEGSVKDYVTHAPLQDSKVYLLSADSVVLDSAKAGGKMMNNGVVVKVFARFYLKLPSPGKYILQAMQKGYDTRYQELDIPKFYKREIERTIEPIYLQKTIATELKNVTVKATKLKFYNKGDTLVYNADAFQLSEGSMLDALIRQLPGAELKQDGTIYVNGKFVESLLLNGKDFFRGNNQIMLDNLPTYMVNQIKVYEKGGDMNRLIGQDVGDKDYIMDVNLKKQYNIGWVGNIEGGGGSDERYLGRLFALRFTDHSRIAVYGNVNNLNDIRKPGEHTDWSPDKMPTGQKTMHMAGIDYNIDDRNKRFNLSGNAQFSHTKNMTDNYSNRSNFLSNGNTYDRILNSSRYYNTQVSTRHRFTFYFKQADLTIRPDFNYHKYKNIGGMNSATSALEWRDFNKEQLDSLFQPILSASMRRNLLNRNIRQSRTTGYDWKGGITVASSIKFKHSSDALSFDGGVTLRNASEDMFNRNRVDYLSDNQGSTDFRNLYGRNKPGKGYDYYAKVAYLYTVKQGLSFTFFYKYNRNYLSGSQDLFRLDGLSGWGADSEYPLGWLPSEREYVGTIDRQNSYSSRQYDNIHETGLSIYWNKWVNNKYQWWLQTTIPVDFVEQRLKYKQAAVDTTIVRRSILSRFENTFLQWNTLDNKHQIFLSYRLDSKTPKMSYLVNVWNDSDPLNITKGNSDLKNMYRHYWYLSYTKRNSARQSYWRPYVSYLVIRNALAMGYVYDKSIGRRTITPENVNGNREGTIGFSFETPLDKKKRTMLSNELFASFLHNVDLAGVEGADVSARSVVNTLDLTESVRLEYKIGQHFLSFKGGGSWLRSTSDRNDFTTINAFNFNYGVIARLELPWKFQLSTDLTMYSRRGYEESSMNSNDLVWNARLSRTLCKGRFVLMVDGFDMLHQLSNIQRFLNAQGRTEVQTNVIPRYVMFHAIYRFNVLPKKKK